MDKQLIERIAMEVANEMPAGYLWSEGCEHESGVVASEVIDFVTRCITRIDAERGKEAVAYLRFWAGRMVSPDGGVECDEGLEVCEEGEVGADGEKARPVFLSPTIPKDMALVPIEIIDRFPEINPSNYDHDDACALNAWGVELVLAAAQGERNAD